MRFFCNNCDEKLSTKHYWEGLSVTCPNCCKPTELSYRVGQSIPGIGYSITFRDFKQLLTEKAYSKAIDPVVEKLLNCSVVRTEMGVRLVEADGSLIPLETAHIEIQNHPDLQGILYNAAMDQWR